jgi:hypothetical protein
MAVNQRVLLPMKTLEAASTTQYTAPVRVMIDKFHATNFSAAVATITVHVVTLGGTAGNENKVIDAKVLQVKECYTFPELVNKALEPGDFIVTVATATAINMGINGRLLT